MHQELSHQSQIVLYLWKTVEEERFDYLMSQCDQMEDCGGGEV